MWKSIWILIGVSIIVAGYRIYQSWEQYSMVVDMGANQLHYMKKYYDQQKKRKKGDVE
jgi:hypothetical protein